MNIINHSQEYLDNNEDEQYFEGFYDEDEKENKDWTIFDLQYDRFLKGELKLGHGMIEFKKCPENYFEFATNMYLIESQLEEFKSICENVRNIDVYIHDNKKINMFWKSKININIITRAEILIHTVNYLYDIIKIIPKDIILLIISYISTSEINDTVNECNKNYIIIIISVSGIY